MKRKNKVIYINNVGNAIARLIPQLVIKAKSVVRDLDSTNELRFIRLKTTKN